MKQLTAKQLAVNLRDAIRVDNRKGAREVFENGILKEPETFIASIKKAGAFRSSQTNFNTGSIKAVIERFQILAAAQTFPSSVSTYISSITELLFIADGLKDIYKSCCFHSSYGFKNYLVTVDDLFWQNHICIRDAIRTDYKSFSKEELAAAFSFYYSMLRRGTNIEPQDLLHLNDKRINTNFYRDKLSAIAKLVAFKEAEILIDSYNYTATRFKKSVTIKPPDAKLEQCIRLGYIREDLQQIADQQKIDQDAPTLEEYVNSIPEDTLDKLFLLETKPPRIAVRLPTDLFIRPFIEEEALLHDETLLVASLCKQLLIDFTRFKTIGFHAGITLWDLLKVRRLFAFIFLALKQWLKRQDLHSTITYYHSLTPVLTHELLTSLLKIGLGGSKATAVLALLRWRPDDETLFDVQSQPLIECGKFVALPLGLLASSNLTRNILQHTRFRFDSETEYDPITTALQDGLAQKFETVKTNVKYKYNNQQGEIDALAVLEGFLFIFECKNSLHPCSPFELRTSYDYIKKAAEQLTRITDLCIQPGFLKYLGNKIHCDLSMVHKIQTCIVMGNRMLSGWSEHGHPVRNIHELLSLIDVGEITFTSLIDPENPYRGVLKVWNSTCFSVTDLVEYCGDDSYLHFYFSSLGETQDTYEIGGRQLSFQTYYLDMATFDRLFRRFAVCSPLDVQSFRNTPEFRHGA